MTYHTGYGEPGIALPQEVGSLVQRVATEITALIRDQGLRAGDALPSEGALAAACGASRTVVREAMRSLASLGLVDVGNGRRARVSLVPADRLALLVDHAVEVEQASVQQVMDVRRTIELRTVSLAALRRTDEEAAAILAHARAMAESRADFALMTEHDIAFHIAIATASRNPMFVLLIEAMKVVTLRTAPVTWTSRRTEAEREAVFANHAAIAEAIAAGDPDAAGTAMAEHFDRSVKALVGAGIL